MRALLKPREHHGGMVPRGLRRADEFKSINLSMPAKTKESMTIKNIVITEVEMLKKCMRKNLLMSVKTIQIMSRNNVVITVIITQSL